MRMAHVFSPYFSSSFFSFFLFFQVLGVEPYFCASLTAALKAGKPVHADTTATLADGLAVPTVSTFVVLLCVYSSFVSCTTLVLLLLLLFCVGF